MRFAEILDNLLKERGAAARLSEKADITERLIGYWRKGEKQPTLDNLVKLCIYFQMSADDLLGIKKEAAPEGERPELTEKQMLVEEIAKMLAKQNIDKLKSLMDFLGP